MPLSSPLCAAALICAVLAAVGIAQAVVGLHCVRRFARILNDPAPLAARPPMTILKPLCGDEPLLEEALASVCEIDYPVFQIVFGVQDPSDPAVGVVGRIRARYPGRDIALVVDPSGTGKNRKICNLLNMLRAAKHDHLVMGDSDVHVAPNYLDAIAAGFARPGTGLVTTLYAGLPSDRSMAGALGATGLSHTFLPGALVARALGRQDALGVTMALRRETLAAIGGLARVADELADDHVLGLLVQQQGLSVRLAATMTATTVPERHIGPLFRHELRWSRTVLSLVPVSFSLSAMQYPLAWASLTLILSGGHEWAVALFLAAWVARAACALGIEHALSLRSRGLGGAPPVLLLPLRDLLSMAVLLASYRSDQVEWRGNMMRTRAQNAPAYAPSRDTAAGSAS
ncbi:MAG TPA: bacteriohopanetetrol glucosamine biosynthesis glycosyltransferase HpnI [Acetobacteraceae bacterium]|nr:bacteriohopanetetrol glucosamine biosynthesis glycosyltransferase HpnI [Acetobacteraceae bacterium]